jgi:hypothetical protein
MEQIDEMDELLLSPLPPLSRGVSSASIPPQKFARFLPVLFTRRGGFCPAPEMYDALITLNEIIEDSMRDNDVNDFFAQHKSLINNILSFLDTFIDFEPLQLVITNSIHTEWNEAVKKIFL